MHEKSYTTIDVVRHQSAKRTAVDCLAVMLVP